MKYLKQLRFYRSTAMTQENEMSKAQGKPKHTRSRLGCRECKRLKMKCDELKPSCTRCSRKGKFCDYSMTLTWGGRPYKKPKEEVMMKISNDFVTSKFDSRVSIVPKAASPIQVKQESRKSSEYLADLGNTIKHYSKNLSDFPLDESQTLSIVPLKRSISRVESQSLTRPKKSHRPNNEHHVHTLEAPSPGIHSLTNALGSVTGDKSTFMHFESFNLLNDLFTTTTTSDGSDSSPSNFMMTQTLTEDQELDPTNIDNLFLDIDSYQEDLMRIDRAFDQDSKNKFTDPFLSRLLFNKKVPLTSLVDSEEEIEDEEDEFDQYNKQIKLISEDFESSSSSSSSPKLSIPIGLVPLPDLLLNVPYYLEHFHFYRNVTSHTLVPAPAHSYKENPFKVVLPRLAMINESILSILVAFGITHKSLMLGQREPREVIDQLLSRCLKDLILLLEDKVNCKSDLTLALVLIIGSFDMFSALQNNWKMHVLGAKQILLKRGLKNQFDKKAIELSTEQFNYIDRLPITVSSDPKSRVKEANVSQFLVGWFNYIDMLSTLATPLKPTRQTLKFDYREKAQHINFTDFNSSYNDGEIDMLLGFDVRFLQIASEMIPLIRETNRLLSTTGSNPDNIPRYVINQGLKIREEINQVYKSSSEKYLYDPDESMDVLKATNELFSLALLIHLYRRVFLLPKDSVVIKNFCMKVVQILKDKIEVGSNLEICSSFVIFTAALEVNDQESRNFFINRLTGQFNIGNYICSKLRDVLQMSWKYDKNWTEIIEENHIDLTFL